MAGAWDSEGIWLSGSSVSDQDLSCLWATGHSARRLLDETCSSLGLVSWAIGHWAGLEDGKGSGRCWCIGHWELAVTGDGTDVDCPIAVL